MDNSLKLKSTREFHPDDTVVSVGYTKVGANQDIVLIGGPCSIESRQQINDIAKQIRLTGANILRGGAYKPRTSPYSFQGLGTDGIDWLCEAGKRYGMPVVSEIMSITKLEEFSQKVDLIQVGARNMQNFDLLRELGSIGKPILLKRGLANTIEEWLLSAEYIMDSGNSNIILCERGIRTFEQSTRNTLDLSAIPIVKQRSHLPIIVDPSHATGDWHLVESMSLAAIAAGADGLILEVHNSPELALSDGEQSILPERFGELVKKLARVAAAVDRSIRLC